MPIRLASETRPNEPAGTTLSRAQTPTPLQTLVTYFNLLQALQTQALVLVHFIRLIIIAVNKANQSDDIYMN